MLRRVADGPGVANAAIDRSYGCWSIGIDSFRNATAGIDAVRRLDLSAAELAGDRLSPTSAALQTNSSVSKSAVDRTSGLTAGTAVYRPVASTMKSIDATPRTRRPPRRKPRASARPC